MGIAISEDRRAGVMSGPAFRAFQDHRPDHERWELIAGVPMMMSPPTIAHNRIAGNLERLLNEALERHSPTRIATQRPGVELGSGNFRPEPDVGVIDADYAAGQRFVERAYLLAEVVSVSDEISIHSTDRRWIDIKREIYLAHEACEAVLMIEQDRIEVRIDLRTDSGWDAATLSDPAAELVLPAFGLRCLIADLYRGTPLSPSRGAHG
jgi:Uma2 family endonuclease